MKKLRRIKRPSVSEDAEIIRIDRDKRLKKKKRRIKVAVILLVIAAIVTVMLSPVFNIKEIKVQGHSKVKAETVLSTCGIIENTNIFKINIKQSKTLVKSIPYVGEVHIYRKLPGKVTISITEREAICYVKNGTGYTLSDIDGRFLETVKKKPERIPEITGMEIKTIKVGNTFGSEYKENIASLNELVGEFKNLEIYERVSQINIKDSKNLTFMFDGNKKVLMGENFRTDYKLMMLKATIEEIAPSEAGTIDLSKEGRALFTPKSK